MTVGGGVFAAEGREMLAEARKDPAFPVKFTAFMDSVLGAMHESRGFGEDDLRRAAAATPVPRPLADALRSIRAETGRG
eukprot:CAMPEP_0118977494 /NCGR_PEP_ID=MMETSP1173-20130426/21567_1 /TAXON_ID=1034831 /ORGANISM="Rhizochromulina marina cf, Strain CCMP1243" /LENGTH=78 /DNA_ID=CAMNT_0006927611 /DNA_START=39 /DNA_END=271 /DNA_ORIENTATION=-